MSQALRKQEEQRRYNIHQDKLKHIKSTISQTHM